MKNLIIEMNHILQQWQSKYDILQLTRLNFSIGDDNVLYLNDTPIQGFHSYPLESVTFNAEQILYFFAEIHTLHVTILWPEEGIPTVSSVHFL